MSGYKRLSGRRGLLLIGYRRLSGRRELLLIGYKRLSELKAVQHNECERAAKRSATLSHGIFVIYGLTIRRRHHRRRRSGRGRA